MGTRSKLIGARFFSQGIRASGALDGGQQPSQAELSSPRDYIGHGSHTLSTAGGSFVPGASVFGHGKGTAAGGSPGARVAAYKACYEAGCSGIDILAAIVAAVEDGVHVLSLSLGGPAEDYLTDLIAIGAFFAVQSGVTVVCSAGNSGPQPSRAATLPRGSSRLVRVPWTGISQLMSASMAPPSRYTHGYISGLSLNQRAIYRSASSSRRPACNLTDDRDKVSQTVLSPSVSRIRLSAGRRPTP